MHIFETATNFHMQPPRFLDAQVNVILLANRGGANVMDLAKGIVEHVLL